MSERAGRVGLQVGHLALQHPSGRWLAAVAWTPPPGRPWRGLVLGLQPLAEEMNRSRRMMALASRAFAAAGFAVLLPDLSGTGDSPGHFGDADWEGWLAEAAQAASQLAASEPSLPLILWGHRCGTLVASALAADWRGAGLAAPPQQLWWQPAVDGATLLRPWQRMAQSRRMLGKDGAEGDQTATAPTTTTATEPARDRDDGALVVGGYRFSPALQQGLASATLQAPPEGSALRWLELVAPPMAGSEDPPPPPMIRPAGQRWLGTLDATACSAHAQALVGPAFWEITESPDVSALIDASVGALVALTEGTHAATSARTLPLLDEASPLAAGALVERGLVIETADGERMAARLTHPADATPVAATLIVVGGPQVRFGAHRSFIDAARTMAAEGHAVLRFDFVGMGDSDGERQPFDASEAEVAAASAALVCRCPAGTPVGLWGLCDGASAALLARPRLERCDAMLLLNPWVRDEQRQARSQLRHHYLDRLRSPEFALRLLRGDVAVGAALRGLVGSVAAALRPTPAAPAASSAATAPTASQPANAASGDGDFVARMDREVLSEPPLRLTVLLAEPDATAREFADHMQASRAWKALDRQGRLQVTRVAGADHTFSGVADRHALMETCSRWARALARADAP